MRVVRGRIVKEHTCEACGLKFPSITTDEEAEARHIRDFKQFSEEDRVTLCEPCYKKFLKWARETGELPT